VEQAPAAAAAAAAPAGSPPRLLTGMSAQRVQQLETLVELKKLYRNCIRAEALLGLASPVYVAPEGEPCRFSAACIGRVAPTAACLSSAAIAARSQMQDNYRQYDMPALFTPGQLTAGFAHKTMLAALQDWYACSAYACFCCSTSLSPSMHPDAVGLPGLHTYARIHYSCAHCNVFVLMPTAPLYVACVLWCALFVY
jgi:hypothetical protein